MLFIQQANKALAQERTISGHVKNASHEALLSASVNLINDKSTIVQFAITNQRGEYSLVIPANESSSPLWLEVSFIGFKKQRKAVESNQSTYYFILAPDTNMLSEVIIKSKPVIELSGDTLKYFVMSFATKEDRSIRDVMRRMPGIEIDADGTIYYNGKKVENLYIQGDDLMDGRYGLATKVIRKEMIASVDIIRNHQPIKILTDKVFSDKTSINLVLKDENSLKLSANLMAGGGLPKQYDVSFTPILLNKHIKMINTLGFNNSGVDYRNDFKQLGSSNFISNIGNTPAEVSLSLATIGPPDLPLSNYYFNRSGIINLNNSYNTQKGLQFKVNIQGYIDKNSLNYTNRVENYLANDTIAYREQQSVYNKPLSLNTSFNVMVNRKQYFFNNNIKIKLSRETNNSFMDFNDHSFGQSVDKTVQEISNDLNWIPSLGGKGIGEVRWLISYSRNKQLLDIGEGYYAEIKDQEGYYDHVLQRLKTPTLFSNAWFGYRIPGNTINQSYKIGFIAESQRLNTSLHFIKNEQTTDYAGDVGNELQWDKRNIYFSTEYQIRHQQLRSTIQLPFTYQDIHYSQKEYALYSKNNRFIFNPSIDVRYDINPEQYLSANYTFSNGFGNITGIYRGAILQNYRMLQANDAGLQEKSTHSSRINYDFQQSIKMLFVNVGMSYDKITARTLLSTDISDNIQKIIFLPYKNSQENIGLRAGYSQYLFRLKSTVSLKSQLTRSSYVQLINHKLLPFYSNSLSLSGNLIRKVFETVNLTYQPSGLWSTTKLKENKGPGNQLAHHAFRFDQYLTLGVNAVKKLNIEILGRHSYSDQSNNAAVQYFFLDTKARYSNTKKGLDLTLSITNLFNVKDYTRYSVFSNQLVIDQYTIRGTMAMLRVDYYF